jgi:putative DNA primase/helicase
VTFPAQPAAASRDDGPDFSSPLSKPYPIAVRAMRQVTEGGPTLDLTDLNRSDAAVARDIALAFRDEFVRDHRLECWRRFDSPVWLVDQVGCALLRMQEHLENRAMQSIQGAHGKADRESLKFALKQLDARRLKAVLDLVGVQSGVAMRGDEFDRPPMLFNAFDGTIELETGRFRSGRPEDYLSLRTSVVYDPHATCPRFLEALNQCLAPDAEALVGFIKRWFGYCLTGLTREQVFLCWWGAGANGKSVLADVLLHLLGSYAITLPFASFTRGSADAGAATPDIARLPGRRLVLASETRITGKFDEGKLKSLTGEDVLTARPLYGHLFEFRSVAKLLFLFNDRPRVTDTSHAFWRRALLVPFQRQFSGADRDDHLRDKLRAEAPGILNWAIEGCLEWQRDGLNPPAAVRSAVDAWRDESDVVAEFIGDGCDAAPGAWVHSREMFAGFTRWCDLEQIPDRDRPGRKAFSARFGTFAVVSRHGNGNGFLGLKPKSGV